MKIHLLNKKNFMIAGITLILIMAIASSVYFYQQYQKVQKRLQNPKSVASEETQILIEKLGKLMELPSDETPTVATITDMDKLKDQQFFANAKNGDKLLVYNQSKRAILYDPIANKIIDIAPVNISSPSATIPTPTITPKVDKTK